MPAPQPPAEPLASMHDAESALRRSRIEQDGIRWEAVSLKQYKEDGTHFRSITRQVLFGEESGLTDEVRYFEIQPDGHSTFERHVHVHAVIILHGAGRVLVGDQVREVHPFDLIRVPPMTWHQFRANPDSPLGFLCLVPCDRDRPQRPSTEDVAALRSDPSFSSFVRL